MSERDDFQRLLDEQQADARAFDLYQQAQDAAARGRHAEADSCYRGAIEEGRRGRGDDGFFLGMYGSYLIKCDRKQEAMVVLEAALAIPTDLSHPWSNYLLLQAEGHDIEGMLETVRRLPSQLISANSTYSWFQPSIARATRSEDFEFALELCRTAQSEARRIKDEVSEWAATGEAGHTLERMGQVESAVAEWTAAFDAGSSDPQTANRLSMILDRLGRLADARVVIVNALERGLPAGTEETLRKRLERIDRKRTPSLPKKDVPAFSVRAGETYAALDAQWRVKPPIRGVVIEGNVATCLGTVKTVSTLTRIDVVSGEVLGTCELPQLTFFRPTSDGWGLGVRKPPRVGEGRSSLYFLEPDGSVHTSVELPDSVSEVAMSNRTWYIGSRIGQLYAFDFTGVLLWNWMVPGANTYEGSPYMRPCPYFVAAAQDFVAVASMEHLYALRTDGALLWEQEVPNKGPTVITRPLYGDSPSEAPMRTLGLSSGSSIDEVKHAYRKLVLDTHPDRNPDDPDASVRFRAIQSAYEAALNGIHDSPIGSVTMTISMQVLVSRMTAVGDSILVSSSDGVLTRLDGSGTIRSRRALGNSQVIPALRDDGSIAATYCDGTLSFFEGDDIVNAAKIDQYPALLETWGSDILTARSASLHVFDARGRVAWDVDFTKRVTGLATYGHRLVCATGALMAFNRN